MRHCLEWERMVTVFHGEGWKEGGERVENGA